MSKMSSHLGRFTVGQFVYVEYDDQNYPGKILKLNESLKELYVQCMKKVNKNSSLYMWPRKKTSVPNLLMGQTITQWNDQSDTFV
jgi:hypothetical protein